MNRDRAPVERENRLVKWAIALVGAVAVVLGVLIRFPGWSAVARAFLCGSREPEPQ